MAMLSGAGAYAAIQAQADRMMTRGPNAANPADGPGFDDILKQVIGSTVDQSRAAEATIQAQVQGKAELIDVVTAISSAEASLETVLAVRDQVIAAYQEILRMPI
jgi:flagellar hook-basal body complex protein FliE